MVKRKTMPRTVDPTTEGSCPYCHKHVQSIEAHASAKHKGEVFTKKELKR